MTGNPWHLSDDDISSIWQWLADGFMRQASHDDGLANGQLFESFEVIGQMPGQFAIATDDVIRRGGNDETDFHI